MPVHKLALGPVFKGPQTWYYDPMKENNMKLFIIKNVLADYTSGMVVIAAQSKDEAREHFIAEFGDYYAKDFDEYGTFTVIENVGLDEGGVVDYVYGGG